MPCDNESSGHMRTSVQSNQSIGCLLTKYLILKIVLINNRKLDWPGWICALVSTYVVSISSEGTFSQGAAHMYFGSFGHVITLLE